MRKNLKINIFFNMLKALMHILFPLISFPYAARVLGVDNIGKVQYSTSIVSYFILLSGLGVTNYATREGTKYRNNRSELSKFAKEVLSINIVSTVCSYLLLFLITVCFLQSYLFLMVVCSFLIAFTTFSIDWIYQIEEDFAYISVRTILFQFLSLICLLLFVKSEDDYITYACITVIANGGNAIFNWVHSRKYIDWFKNYGKHNYKRHIKPILIIFSISASTSIYLHLDSVMVGSMKGDYEVGLYSAATKLVSVVKSMITSISAVMLSRLSYYVNNNEENRYNSLLSNAGNYILMLAIPAGTGLLILSREILLLFCGTEYLDAEIAGVVLSINMIFSIVDGMLYNQIFLPLKMERKASVATITGAISNFVLNLIFIHFWGFTGAAITTLISECVVFIILTRYSKEKVHLKGLFSNVIHYVLGSFAIIAVGIIGKFSINSDYIRVAAIVPISVIVYSLCLLGMRDSYALKIRDGIARVIRLNIKK